MKREQIILFGRGQNNKEGILMEKLSLTKGNQKQRKRLCKYSKISKILFINVSCQGWEKLVCMLVCLVHVAKFFFRLITRLSWSFDKRKKS